MFWVRPGGLHYNYFSGEIDMLKLLYFLAVAFCNIRRKVCIISDFNVSIFCGKTPFARNYLNYLHI